MFIIDPYIPAEGRVLLWGDTSIGKSPLTWEMARAIGSGRSFFGLPTREARVLYLEADTPEILVADRLKKISPPPPNVWFEFIGPLSMPVLTPTQHQLLHRLQAEINPEVVFINTLRQVHDMDDKESHVPKMVYSAFHNIFPSSVHTYTHHVKKRSADPKAIIHNKEGFSGSKAWLNDAQVGLHLEAFHTRDGKENLRLYHRKSQVSKLLRPLPLFLGEDGTKLTSYLYDELEAAYLLRHEYASTFDRSGMVSEGRAKDFDRALAKQLGISERTARRRRHTIEKSTFPGKGYLERADEEEIASGDESD